MSFDINARIRGDNSDLKGKLKEIESATDQVAAHAKSALGGNFFGNLLSTGFKLAGAAAIFNIGKEFADAFAANLKDVKIGKARTGLDTETFQRFKNITEATGESVGTVEKAMDHVAEKQQAVKDGGVEGAKALENFGKVGASAADVQSKSYQDLTIQIFKYLQGVEITGEKIAALKQIFGKSGPDLLPAIALGLDSSTAERGLIDDDDLKKAADFKKSMSESASLAADIKNEIGRVFTNLGRGLAAPLRNGFWKTIFQPGVMIEEAQRRGIDASNRKQFQEKDEARRAQEGEAANFDKAYEEFQDQYLEEEEKAKEKAKAEGSKLTEKILAKEQQDKYNAMSPDEKKAYLRDQISAAKGNEAAALKTLGQTGDPRDNLEFLQHRMNRTELEEQLKKLESAKTSAVMPEVRDSLARIGVGFLAPDQTVGLLRSIDGRLMLLVDKAGSDSNGEW